ncbi:CoA-binding protein [Anaerosporomusa subterranea]|jgi:predicted CoA-binding protein|uniref:CoA-binding protein n=1 Tax=Anaerosporomusa subterranea TaxID=1794912 RepID=A0A154BT36_ANASB|nr:CoA-binding protein [Anaerosporomusa subterranea]KYZ77091.1 CoA-binding protein [Anaerosporomusa subterranea]
MDAVTSFLNKKIWAIVGATDNTEKFGYKIYKCMKTAGYTVYPVNPGVSDIQGVKCYPRLQDLPEQPEVVDVVVPPKVGEQIMKECAEAGIKNVWLQPGANAESVSKLGKQLGLEVIDTGCVMSEIHVRGISHK